MSAVNEITLFTRFITITWTVNQVKILIVRYFESYKVMAIINCVINVLILYIWKKKKLLVSLIVNPYNKVCR